MGSMPESNPRVLTETEVSCEKGHQWLQSARSKNSGRGCPYCARKKAWPGETDMFTEAPELEVLWDWGKNSHLDPKTLLKGSDKKVWWICANGHSLEKKVDSFYRSRCGICSNKVLQKGFNDLATVRPDLAKEFDSDRNNGQAPQEFLYGSGAMVWWLCDDKHPFRAKISQRNFSSTKCPYCSGKATLPGFNDLETKFPEVAKSWNSKLNSPTLPREVASTARTKYWWNCALGHSWLAAPSDRTSHGQGCAVCANRQVVVGVNDLQTLSPDIAATLAPGKNPSDFALTVGAHSRAKAWWICTLQHEYFKSVYQRQAVGCAYCANQKVLSGYNDLASQNPEAARYFLTVRNQISATEVLVGSRIFFWWACELGHEFRRTPSSILRGIWCPFCGHYELLVGFNDLATEAPEIAVEWHPSKNGELTAADVMNGSHTKFWWLCMEGHTFEQSGKKRRQEQGCPTCAVTGYSPGKPGYLYLLTKPELGLHQFGISNTPKKRTDQHKRNGWELLDVIGPADGYWIVETEAALKTFFATKGELLGRDYEDKFDGYTESWRSTEVQFKTVAEMLSALREFEDESD
jgi:hypothetical protein